MIVLRRLKLLSVAQIAIGNADTMGRIVLPYISGCLMIGHRRFMSGMKLIVTIAIDPQMVTVPIEITPIPICEGQEKTRIEGDRVIVRGAIARPWRIIIGRINLIGPPAKGAPRVIGRDVNHLRRRR